MHCDRQSFLHSVASNYSDSQNSHGVSEGSENEGRGTATEQRSTQREEQFMNKLISYTR